MSANESPPPRESAVVPRSPDVTGQVSAIVPPAPRPATIPPASMDRTQAAVHCVVAACVLALGLFVASRSTISREQVTFCYWCLAGLLLLSGAIKLSEVVGLRSQRLGSVVAPVVSIGLGLAAGLMHGGIQ